MACKHLRSAISLSGSSSNDQNRQSDRDVAGLSFSRRRLFEQFQRFLGDLFLRLVFGRPDSNDYVAALFVLGEQHEHGHGFDASGFNNAFIRANDDASYRAPCIAGFFP
jgi:hypothetical protein